MKLNMENGYYTVEDIGTEVEVVIEKVRLYSEVISVMTPDGKTLIGPEVSLAHIFARYTMIPGMIAASEATKEAFRQMEDGA